VSCLTCWGVRDYLSFNFLHASLSHAHFHPQTQPQPQTPNPNPTSNPKPQPPPSAADLTIYGSAIQDGAPLIPATLLTTHPGEIIMPPKPGESLVVEPWIAVDEMRVGEGGAVEAGGKEPWVEFTVGLIGDLVS